MRKAWQTIRILADRPMTAGAKAANEVLRAGVTPDEARQAYDYISKRIGKYNGKLPRSLYAAKSRLSAIIRAARPAIEEEQILGIKDLKDHNPPAHKRCERMSPETKKEVVLIENHTLHAVRVNNTSAAVSYIETVGGITRDVRNLPKTTHLVYLFAVVKLFQEHHEDLLTSELATDKKGVTLKIPLYSFCRYIHVNDYEHTVRILKSLRDFYIYYTSRKPVNIRGTLKKFWNQHFLRDAEIISESGKDMVVVTLDYQFVNDCIQGGFFINLEHILRLKSDRAKLLAIKLMADRAMFSPGVSEKTLLDLLGFPKNKKNIKEYRHQIREYIDDLVSNGLMAQYADFSEVKEKVGAGHYLYHLSIPQSVKLR